MLTSNSTTFSKSLTKKDLVELLKDVGDDYLVSLSIVDKEWKEVGCVRRIPFDVEEIKIINGDGFSAKNEVILSAKAKARIELDSEQQKRNERVGGPIDH